MTQKQINEINKELDQLSELWELYGYRVFDKALREQIKGVIELLKSSKNVELSNTLFQAYVTAQPIADSLRKFYEKVGMSAAKANYNYIKQFSKANLLGIEYYSPVWRRAFLEYFMTTGAQHVTEITKTTLERIQRAFTETIEKKEGWQKAVTRIREYALGDFVGEGKLRPRARAKLIARTEMLMISNEAYSVASEGYPYVMDKQWVHNHSTFERAWHLSLNKQRINWEEKFNVRGKMMKYPGDPVGGASENCNCKCRFIAIPKEDEEGNLILK